MTNSAKNIHALVVVFIKQILSMKKLLFGLFLLSSSLAMTQAQGFDRSKMIVGGSFGMQFGDYTLVSVAPQVGYQLSPYFTAGAGVSYTYFKRDYWATQGSKNTYHSSYFGMSVFGRVYPVQYLVLSVQPEASRMWRSTGILSNKVRETKFVPSVLIGAGVRFGPVTAMIQYDVVQDKDSPYSDNLFYSVGYTFSF